MARMKICTCGKLIPVNDRCECKREADRARNKRKDERNPDEKKFFNSMRWKKLRKSIISRDGGHCQRCVYKYNVITSDNLQVHHIKPRVHYPEFRYDENNLITLCQSCNTQLGINDELDFKWHGDEVKWEPIL